MLFRGGFSSDSVSLRLLRSSAPRFHGFLIFTDCFSCFVADLFVLLLTFLIILLTDLLATVIVYVCCLILLWSF